MTFDLPERPQSHNPVQEDNSEKSGLARKDIQQIVHTLKGSESALNRRGFLMEILSENADESLKDAQKPSMLQVIVKDEKRAESKSPFLLRNPSIRLEIDPILNQVSILSKPFSGIGSSPTMFIKDYFDKDASQRIQEIKKILEEFLSVTIRNSVPA